MYLCDGKIGNEYKVEDIDLPVNIEKRLEALGMTRGTSIAVLNSKSRGCPDCESQGEHALHLGAISQRIF